MNKSFLQLSTALVFIFCFLHTTAQIKIEGVVRDARSGAPLQFVVVTHETSRAGDVTTEKGNFSVLVDKLPATLSFRLIGYEKTIIQVTKDKRLDVKMAESVVEMNTVEILASQLEKVAGNDKRSIWDYTWCNGQLLICDYGTSLKTASLILLDENLDMLHTLAVPSKPVELFSDCMGNAHFKGQDSTWQILNEDGHISLLPAESNYLVENILRKCKAADDKNLYFEVANGEQLFNESSAESFAFKSTNDEIYYFYGSRNGSKLIFLTKITDEVSKKLKEEELKRDSVMHSKKHQESYASAMASKHFFYSTMVKEIYAPIMSLDGKTFIMDYVNGQLVEFDSTMTVASVDSIRFDYIAGNPFRCLTDEEHTAIYVLDNDHSISVIHLLDTNGCEIQRSWKIPHAFPENVTVQNGYV